MKNNFSGTEFKNLSCRKVYVYGDVDVPQQTLDFVRRNNLPSKLFTGVGHWHMLENAVKFYNFVKDFSEINNEKG